MIASLIALAVSFVKPKLREKEIVQNMYILVVYSLATIVAVIPIADSVHFLGAAICGMILLVYLVYSFIVYVANKFIKEEIKHIIKIFVQAFSIILLIVYIGLSLLTAYNYIIKVKDQNQVNHFKYVLLSNDYEAYERITTVGEYILEQKEEGKTVYILDGIAMLYTLPIDVYNKDYDLFNLGNFGIKGTEGLIEDLKNTDNLIVLIKQDMYEKNWQHPTEVTDYAIENFEKIGEISYFDIYEKE